MDDRYIERFASTKLTELFNDGYTVTLDGDSSFYCKMSLKLKKDGNIYLFTVRETRIVAFGLDGVIIELKRIVKGFPSQKLKECLYSKIFYNLDDNLSNKHWYTDDIEVAKAVNDKRWAKRDARQVEYYKFKCRDKAFIAKALKQMGIHADAEELTVCKWPDFYEVSYKNNNVSTAYHVYFVR